MPESFLGGCSVGVARVMSKLFHIILYDIITIAFLRPKCKLHPQATL